MCPVWLEVLNKWINDPETTACLWCDNWTYNMVKRKCLNCGCRFSQW